MKNNQINNHNQDKTKKEPKQNTNEGLNKKQTDPNNQNSKKEDKQVNSSISKKEKSSDRVTKTRKIKIK